MGPRHGQVKIDFSPTYSTGSYTRSYNDVLAEFGTFPCDPVAAGDVCDEHGSCSGDGTSVASMAHAPVGRVCAIVYLSRVRDTWYRRTYESYTHILTPMCQVAHATQQDSVRLEGSNSVTQVVPFRPLITSTHLASPHFTLCAFLSSHHSRRRSAKLAERSRQRKQLEEDGDTRNICCRSKTDGWRA